MTLRRSLVSLHRWLGLAAALLWLLQAATGTLIVFHWEIDDATVAGAHRPTDLAALQRRADAFAAAGAPVQSIWTSAGALDRWDLSLANGDSVRVDGAGDVLRTRRDGDGLANGGLIDRIVVLHQSLLAGDAGHWIIGLSGVLLLTNLALGLCVAWPRRDQWRRAIRPISPKPVAARHFSWHRAVGLWAVIPAMLAIACGTVLALSDAFASLAPAPPAVAAHAAEPIRIGMIQAIAIARRRHPGASLSGIDFAAPASPSWTVHLKQRGERVRAYGNTNVTVDAATGAITADDDALRGGAGKWLHNHYFAIHTGEIAGLGGRVAMFAIGLWLLAMIYMGTRLWLARRR
ncbi:MAG: PepSY domain-containing protein [Sphingomonadaceae bacterium]|nr:PepSY domain-containing protein [Sphingomonadaceae bacterium]